MVLFSFWATSEPGLGSLDSSLYIGLIILNAWYGKFVTDNSRKNERAKVIDVTVPLQCLVKDSKLILTEASKVQMSYLGISTARIGLQSKQLSSVSLLDSNETYNGRDKKINRILLTALPVSFRVSMTTVAVLSSCLGLTHAIPQAGLPGFYDPCVGEEKSLKLLYQFRGAMHQVLSGDTEALRIPKQCE